MKVMLPTRRLAIGFALLLAAVIGELAFGTWLSADPLDKVAVGRDVSVSVDPSGLYPGAEPFEFRRDRWGFRGAGLDPASVTLLTIGDGATIQSRLPDQATWQAVLGRELAAQDIRAVIANAGVEGMGAAELVDALELWFPHVRGLKPRFVLAHVGMADARTQDTAGERLEDRSLLRRSALARLWPRMLPADAPIHWKAAVELDPYKDRLKRMAAMIHSMGAVPVLVTQAHGGGGGKTLEALNAATLEVCRDQGLLCLDLAREVPFGEGDFYDAVHHTPQGSEKVGRWLARKLAGLV